MMGVRVGQPTGAFRAPHGIESADHMSAIEDRGDMRIPRRLLETPWEHEGLSSTPDA